MEAWFEDALIRLSETPWLQGALAAVSTFVLEDPTLLMCAVLVAEDHMFYMTALVGLSLGIGIGDWGLYAIGRAVGPKTVAWGWVSQRRLDNARGWFERNLVASVFISRFVPGLRLPANLAAGIAQASPMRYLPIALLASLVWVFIALSAIATLGGFVLPLLGQLKWPAVFALIAWIIFMQHRIMARMKEEEAAGDSEGAVASNFEFLHPIIFYFPVAVYYGWLSLKYRSLMLPTAANPSIYSGGMIRESKCDILDMLPESIRDWVAPHARLDVPMEGMDSSELLTAAKEALARAEIDYPIVAKPDEGQRGVGVRPIDNDAELSDYLQAYPKGASVCLQKRSPHESEVGLLYHRVPGQDKGMITSVTAKDFPGVLGDGMHTLNELILADPRASIKASMFEQRHFDRLVEVLPDGEYFPLVFAGNHKQGCIFRDGSALLADALVERIDAIAQEIPDFYFGRFDVRYQDEESLGRGENFHIIEINGAGAEATHIWDPNATITDAYATLFEQFRVLFEIGDKNRAEGHAPMRPIAFLKDVWQYHRVARHYPTAH
ncbi:MAG: VTT domain-containing protein [Candidatus Hydrogenedentota bacterium]